MKLKKNKLFGLEKRMLVLIVANSLISVMLIGINFILFYNVPSIFSPINIIAAFVIVFPIVIVKYMDYNKTKEIEDLFPVFLRDFVESIRSGMTLPAALKTVANNDYKHLTPAIKKMSAQLDWGIPVETVLLNFANESKSKLIKRIISSVRESHRFGGNLSDTFEALSNTAVEVDRLRAERRLYLNSQLITGYIVFFVFLAVIIGLEKFLVPSLTNVSPIEMSGVSSGVSSALNQQNISLEYKDLLRNLILIQGLFAGLAVGKMSEGAMIAGLKHSLFMMFTGALIFIVIG